MGKTSFFKLDRDIFNSDIWRHPQKLRLFIYLLGNARYSEGEIKKYGVTLKPGQFIRSYRNIQKDLAYLDRNAEKELSVSQIKRLVHQLVTEERVKIETTQVGTLFTICNYSEYQLEGYDKSKVGTAMEQQRNSNGTATEQYSNKDNNNNNNNNIYIGLVDFWNKHDIVNHTYQNKSLKKAFRTVKDKPQELKNLKIAIPRYARAYKDKDYYYEHKWTLDKFIRQSNGYPDWLDEGQRWVEYKEKKGIQPERKLTKEEIAKREKQKREIEELVKRAIN